MYKALQTGPNAAFGGVHEGFFNLVYLYHSMRLCQGAGEEDSVTSTRRTQVHRLLLHDTQRGAPIFDSRDSKNSKRSSHA